MRKPLLSVGVFLALAACATPGDATRPATWRGPVEPLSATAELKDQQGQDVGRVELHEGPNGVVLRVKLSGVTPGEHAFHVHETGQCAPPFQTAGGHFNPRGHQHGIHNPQGKHAGDLPNLHVPQSGELEVELFSDSITLREGQPGSVFDADGSALIIHEGVDDYRSDPTGNAGGRYACGVIRKSP